MSRISKEDKLLILVIALIFSLTYLYVTKNESYYKYERVQCESSGATLYANLYFPSHSLSFQTKVPLIIYCHGIGSQRDFDLRVPLEFTKRGFFVAALDYQGHGESGGNIYNFNENTGKLALAEDCSNLLDKLETLPFFSFVNRSQIGLIGHSLGGMVIMLNQAFDNRFKVSVAWAPLVDPSEVGMFLEERFVPFYPINVINSTNTKNLLIIMDTDDRALDYRTQALKAYELTNCSLYLLSEPLIGGGHQLFSNQVIVKSINWFESHFFGSTLVNGPITITFLYDYASIFLTMILLFLLVLSSVSYSARVFSIEPKLNLSKIGYEVNIRKSKIIKQVIKIAFYSVLFVLNWELYTTFFGIIGIFYASLAITFIYLLIYLLNHIKRILTDGIKFDYRSLLDVRALFFLIVYDVYFIIISYVFPTVNTYEFIEVLVPILIVITIIFTILTVTYGVLIYIYKYKQIREDLRTFNLKSYLKDKRQYKVLAFATLSAFYFIFVYLTFSFFYPFAFMWPSNFVDYVLTVIVFPIYFSLEILYRKVIYPKLTFVKSERKKSLIIIILAIYVQINLVALTWSWAFFPSMLFMYAVFLIVVILNTIVFQHTRSFGSVAISSFEIIQLFFSAVLSNALGIGAVLHIFVQL